MTASPEKTMHIDKEAKKASKGIGMLRRTKELLDINSLKNIYNAFVLPHFDHCALVWEICSKTMPNKLQIKSSKTKLVE